MTIKSRTTAIASAFICVTILATFPLLLPNASVAQSANRCTSGKYMANRLGLSNYPKPGNWDNSYLAGKGFRKINDPQPGAVVVLERTFPGSDRRVGHVGVIEATRDTPGGPLKIDIRSANQYIGSPFFTEYGCKNVRVTSFNADVRNRTDISYWVRDAQPALFPDPIPSNPLRGFLHPMNGAGNYSSNHDAPYEYADDLGIPIGTDILAMRGGKVIAVRQDVADMSPDQEGTKANELNVNYLLIEHDSDVFHKSGKPYRSMYLHIKQNSVVVKEGDRIKAGQLIAKSGHNGWSTGPHLHVEVNYSTGSGVFQRQTVPYIWDKPFDYNK